MNENRRSGVTTGRKIAVYQQPNIAVSRNKPNTIGEKNANSRNTPRRIVDPRDVTEREQTRLKKEQSRRISVATSCISNAQPEKKTPSQRRKSAPAMPSSMNHLSKEEQLLIANFRLQQIATEPQPQHSSASSLKTIDFNQSKKNRKVSFLNPLTEEEDY